MADLLKAGAAWLQEKLKANASRAVIYQRGADQVTVQATLGKTLLQLDDGQGGVLMEWTDRDYIVATADLVLSGNPVTPAKGDKIIDAEDGATYEVLAPGQEPVWKWADPYHTMRRIHAKQVT